MPYIFEVRREFYSEELERLLSRMREADYDLRKGDVTYLITKIIVNYIKVKGKSYDTLSDVDGILGTAAKEFYDRVTAPYEKQKREVNGDVYE